MADENPKDEFKPIDRGHYAPIPSHYSNRFQVVVTDETVRLTFGEGIGENVIFHTAITLSPRGASTLANQLLKTISLHAEKRASQKEKTEAEKKDG